MSEPKQPPVDEQDNDETVEQDEKKPKPTEPQRGQWGSV